MSFIAYQLKELVAHRIMVKPPHLLRNRVLCYKIQFIDHKCNFPAQFMYFTTKSLGIYTYFQWTEDRQGF